MHLWDFPLQCRLWEVHLPEQQAQQEHKAHPKNYRFNLNIPLKYKDYLQEIAWQNRTTITEYLVGLVAADAEKHPEILEKIEGKA